MRYIVDDSPSLTGRFVAAVMAFVFAAVTVIAIPWFLAWEFPIKYRFIIPMPRVFGLYGFYCWVFGVSLAALVLGFKSGFTKTLELFNLIWGTGESADLQLIKLARELRSIFPLTGFVSFILIVISR
jgi:hypothetical protein